MDPTSPIRPPKVRPLRKGERNIELEQDRAEKRKIILEEERTAAQRRAQSNEKGAQKFNKDYNLVMSALKSQVRPPVTSQQYTEASIKQKQQAVDDFQIYKNAANSLLTLAELGFSGTSLFGAYSNWKKWATSANIYKQAIANLLQRAQMPAQIGGTVIDGLQTYDALQKDNNFETYYNGASGILGAAGSIGASDVFLNSRFHNAKLDRLFDAAGILQSAGDFVKYPYDVFKNQNNYDKK